MSKNNSSSGNNRIKEQDSDLTIIWAGKFLDGRLTIGHLKTEPKHIIAVVTSHDQQMTFECNLTQENVPADVLCKQVIEVVEAGYLAGVQANKDEYIRSGAKLH